MIYDDFKHKLIDQIETNRDVIISEDSNKATTDLLFDIRDVDDKKYQRILDSCNRIAQNMIKDLIIDRCNAYNIPCEGYSSHKIGHNRFRLEINFDLTINDKLHHAVLRDRPNNNAINKDSSYLVANYDQCNQIDIIFLVKNDFLSKKIITQYQEDINKLGYNFNAYSLEDYLAFLFGDEEGQMFHDAMNNYKKEVHEAIGYQITEICSPHNLEKLKHSLKEEIPLFNYEEIKAKKYEEVRNPNTREPYEIYNNNFESIKEVYLGSGNYRTGRYKLLLKNSDFADSFLTSEWLYKRYISSGQKYDIANQLDNTFIVSGYLKSVEQLLWDIIYIIGQGRNIQKKNGRYYDFVELTEANLTNIDMTLGSLECFLGDYDNDDIWIQDNRFVTTYIKAQIDDWKNKNRNGYFHKDNLHDVAKIKNIRDDTYFLYMLILGSIRLNEEQLEKLS